MLAEIFFLRLETMVRAADAAGARNTRFVSLSGGGPVGLGERRAGEPGKEFGMAQSA